MKTKMKKILIGGLTIGAVVAPIASTVACGSSSTTTQSDKIIKDGDKIWATGSDNTTYADFKNIVDKQQDAQTASSSFISQIKYELTETLYTKEQIASKDYQVAFLKWNVYTQEKNQIALAKDMAAQIYDEVATASIIDNKDTTTNGRHTLKDALGMTKATPSSKEIFEFVYSMNAPDYYVSDSTKSIHPSRKDTFKRELETFKKNFDSIKIAKEEITKLEGVSADNMVWADWNNSTKYPKLLRPLSEITKEKRDAVDKIKAETIDKYKTKEEGVEAWSTQRSSSYGGASTDEEAVKYLVNQDINAAAFGKFTYSLDSSYTIEQLLAKDDQGKNIFTWLGGHEKELGDKNWIANSQHFYIWTNDLSKFKDANGDLIKIDTENIKDQEDQDVTSLLSNHIYFLSKKTLDSADILVKLDIDKNLENSPIMITHSLIGAKQDTTWNLPWTVTKDSIKNLLSFTNGTDIKDAKLGIDLFSKLYMDDTVGTTNKDLTDLFNQFVSDDTGSREKNGELGVQTYQWYARKGGMNDGFALATMVAYSDIKNQQNVATPATGFKEYDVAKAINNNGEAILSKLKTEILSKIPQDILKGFVEEGSNNSTLSLEEAISGNGDTFKAGLTTTEINNRIANWINGLSDDNIKVMFGSIFRDAFENRPVVYELNPSSGQIHNRFLLASPDSGVHIIKITADGSDWQQRYEEDMKNVSNEDDAAKAKVDWSKLYSDFFTDNEKISNLINIPEFKNQIKELPTTNATLVGEWEKAGYVKFETTDDAQQKGQKIVEAIEKSIRAEKIASSSQGAIDSLTDRINTYLIGQQDNKFMTDTIEPTTLYNELLRSLTS